MKKIFLLIIFLFSIFISCESKDDSLEFKYDYILLSCHHAPNHFKIDSFMKGCDIISNSNSSYRITYSGNPDIDNKDAPYSKYRFDIEYKAVNGDGDWIDFELRFDNMIIKALNILGADGWEVIGNPPDYLNQRMHPVSRKFIPSSHETYFRFLLKKKILKSE